MHESNKFESDRARSDRPIRIIYSASFLAAIALATPSSGYIPNIDGVSPVSAEQAFGQTNIPPNPTTEALQNGIISIPEQEPTSPAPSATQSEPKATTPQEALSMPEQDPGYTHQMTATTGASSTPSTATKTKGSEVKTHSKNTSNPEKTKIPSVNASKPTAFIAPEILDYVAGVGEVKSDHEPDGSWSITPPEATNAELQMVWWWNEKSKIGTNMKGTGYLYAHKCHEGASIVCAGDNFDKLHVNDKIKLPTEDGTVELTVINEPMTLPKTAEGIGSSGIYKYDRPGIVWLITCSYDSDGQTSVNNTAVETKVTNASTQKYYLPKD